jgi:hypothetical protein
VLLHLREPSFPSQKTLFNIVEFGAMTRVGITILDLRKEGRHRTSRLCDAGSKSCYFGFRALDRRTHGFLNERGPAAVGCPVAIGRTKRKKPEDVHGLLQKNAKLRHASLTLHKPK